MATAHRQTCYGATLWFADYTIVRLNMLDNITKRIHKTCIVFRFHTLSTRWINQTLGCLTRSCLLPSVTVGYNHNHWLTLTLSDKIIHNMLGTTLNNPSLLVTTRTVQQIEYGVLLLALLISCGSIDCNATVKTERCTMIPLTFQTTVSNICRHIVIAIASAHNHDICHRSKISIEIDIGRVVNLQSINNKTIIEKFRNERRRSPLPHSLIATHHIGTSYGLSIRCCKVANNRHLLCIGSLQTERYTSIAIKLRRYHLRCSPQSLLGRNINSHTHQGHKKDKTLFHSIEF